jgi:hypothetical protein
MAMQPEPVPTSAARRPGFSFNHARAISINISVSGRGISTSGETVKSSPKNSQWPSK